MEKILILILLILGLYSCENRIDLFEKQNTAPGVGVRKHGVDTAQFTLTLKDTMKLSQESVSYDYKITTDDEKTELSLSVESGEIRLTDETFLYTPTGLGKHTITIDAVDYYGLHSESATISLEVIDNLPPVPVFTYTLSNNFIRIDASDSYDRDRNYGGEIRSYMYTVNGIQYGPISNNHFEQYITLLEHNTIMVSVMDNDNTWTLSEPEIF